MRYVLSLMLLLTLGCDANQTGKEVVPLADISPEVMDAAKKALPKVKFEDAPGKMQVAGEDVFEIRGKMTNGKIREVEVSGSGKVIEVK